MYVHWIVSDYLIMALSLPLVFGHYVVYAQQWRLFRRDVERIGQSLQRSLFGRPAQKQE